MLCIPRKIRYVVESDCIPFCGEQDLQFKLHNIETRDIILYPKYVLSLIIPYDKRTEWEAATKFASSLRNIPSDYRYSLLKFRTINQDNRRKKYSYVSL